MNDQVLMFVLSTVVGLISAIFWKWVATLSKSNDQTVDKIDGLKSEVHDLRAEVYRHYQSKSDAERDHAQVMTMLSEIKASVANLNDKLDSKADK